ncbi:MAG TPA: MMPL family transporter [Planctomycetota bacterium]|nr:MMPL family transporter [Planctomycetota bacterium]
MSGVLERAGLQVLRHPRRVAGVAVLLTALCIFGLLRLRIDPDLEHLLPPGDPTLRLTRHLQGASPPTKTLFIILRGDDASTLEEAVAAAADALRSDPLLAQVSATRQEFAGPRVDWVLRSPLHFVDEPTLERLEARLSPEGRRAELETLQRRIVEDPLAGKATALADPLGLRWIFDEASERLSRRFPAPLRPGTPYLVVERPAVAFIKAVGRESSARTPFAHELLDDVRARLERATVGKNVRIAMAGSYVSAVTQEAALRRDMIVETAMSTIAVLLYVWWFSRSLFAAHLVFIPVGLAIGGSLALGGVIFGPLTPIVVSAAAILIAQGIDFPVHYFCRYRDERLKRDREGALHAAQVSMARPFIGIAATTLAAFLALLVCRFPGFRQFGFVLSVGIVLCLIAALGLFPVLLHFVDHRVRPATERIPWIVQGAEAFLRTRWRLPLAIVLALLGLASWAWVAREGVRIDLDLRNAMAPGDPGRAELERLEKDLDASLIPVYALVDPSRSLNDLRRSAEQLRESRQVAAVDGPQDLIPTPLIGERVQRFRDRTKGWVEGTLADLGRLGFKPEPFRRGLDAMEARFAAPAPALEDLNKPEFAALRESVRYAVDGRQYQLLTLIAPRSLWDDEGRKAFDAQVRAQLGADVQLFSAFHLPDHYSEVLNSDLKRVFLLTAAGIVVLTLLSVGRLGDGLIALAPVVLSTGITLMVVVLMGGKINVINMAAIPIILAVGVDGGIHFMVRFRESRNRNPAEIIREVGPGIWGSAATTILGFGSIAYSYTPGMASMGYLVVIGTVTSVLASLFFLPGILRGRTLPPQ